MMIKVDITGTGRSLHVTGCIISTPADVDLLIRNLQAAKKQLWPQSKNKAETKK